MNLKSPEFINSVLVFSAVGFITYLAVSNIFSKADESTEGDDVNTRTGMRRFISPARLLRLRLTVALFMAVCMMLILVASGVLNPLIYIPISIGFGVLGFWLPYWYYSWKTLKRHESFENLLLDLTTGLASGMKSGLALPQALEATAKRLPDPMKEEINTVLREYRLGIDLAEALTRLNVRMPCEDLNLLVTTIKLTTKSGGSMVEVLTKMVDMIRGRKEFQERLKNLTAQGKFEAIAMSAAPFLAFILLYIIDPDLMGPMLTTGIGWCAFGAVAILVTIGFLIIKKIVTIEV
jgi:tight adherence protein B